MDIEALFAEAASHAARYRRTSYTALHRPRLDQAAALAAFEEPLPEAGAAPEEVLRQLVERAEPGLGAMTGPRFFGWVIGGTLPAALAADWLTSAWDQNTGMRYATPGAVAVEEVAGSWLIDLLGMPPESVVGFTTGATMANFSGLAAARNHVLAAAGWDVEERGLAGGPRVRVIVGEERHSSVDLALRYLGLGAPTRVASDDQGRILMDGPKADVIAALAGSAKTAAEGPTP